MIETYKDVYVGGHGIIYDSNFNILSSTLDRYEDFGGLKSWPKDDINFNPSRKVVNLPEGEYIHLLHPHDIHVWGHFREILSQLYFFQDESFKDAIALVNPSHFGEERRDLHFDAFGFSGRVAKVRPSTNPRLPYYKVPTLHRIPASVFRRPSSIHLNFIREKWFSFLNLPAARVRKKLYLSRASTHVRRVLNEDEVIQFLTSCGFYIFTGKESFRDQAHLFRDADIIIGAHGAAFFNCIFCNFNPRILEVCPDNREVHMWKGQTELLGATNYSLVTQKGDRDLSHEIPIQLIKDFLNKE